MVLIEPLSAANSNSIHYVIQFILFLLHAPPVVLLIMGGTLNGFITDYYLVSSGLFPNHYYLSIAGEPAVH